MTFEYKVVPAPTRGRRAKGAKTAADRFAHALEALINELAAEGWEYVRTDTLPSEERHGLTGRSTVYQNMLVFRRALDAPGAAEPVREAAAIAPAAPRPIPAEPAHAPVARPVDPASPEPAPKPTTDDEASEVPPAKAALHTRIASEIAAARAPKLPSAGSAQKLPETETTPVFSASRRKLVAE